MTSRQRHTTSHHVCTLTRSQTTMVLQQTPVKDCVRTKVEENDCLYTWLTLTDNKKRPPRAGHGVKGHGNTCCGVVNRSRSRVIDYGGSKGHGKQKIKGEKWTIQLPPFLPTDLHSAMTVCVYLHSNFFGGLGKMIFPA